MSADIDQRQPSPSVAPDRLASPAGAVVDSRMRPAGRLSTATRLALLQAAILAVILAAVVLSVTRTYSTQSEDTTSHLLNAEVDGFRAAADHRPAGTSLRQFSHRYLQAHPLPQGEVLLIGFANGTSLGSAEAQPISRSAAVNQLLTAPPAQTVRRTVRVGTASYVLLAVPVRAGSVRATFLVAASQAQVDQNESRVLHLALIEALIALLAGATAGLLLLRGLLGRIRRVTDTAASLGRGELDRRLAESTRDDEVGQLAATFDRMAERLAAAIGSQRRLLADVSHQLRTPLTIARGHLEVLDRTNTGMDAETRDTVRLVVDELDHMTAQVEGLLMLGKALEPTSMTRQLVEVRALITDVADAAQVLADRSWVVGTVDESVLIGSHDGLRGAMLNLVDNAIKATNVGGRIELTGRQYDDGSVELAVLDSGTGIPRDKRDDVLDRFTRLGTADSRGAGLGLAIVKAVAEAHGGSVVIGDSPLGGVKIGMLLPPSARPAEGEGR